MVTVPLLFAGLAVVTALLPVLLVLAFVVDVARLRTTASFIGVRLVLFAWWFLAVEAVGVLSLGAIGLLAWATPGPTQRRREAWTWIVQRAYTGALFAGVRAVLSLSFRIDGQELAARGPFVLLVRHASIVDTLLPARFVANAYAMKLRYVLKRELRVDPCLDIAGGWLPNHFVKRDGTMTAAEIADVGALARGLGPDESALIYPEGTRFTAGKRARAIERLALAEGSTGPDRAARARQLRHLLPPRLGGTLALLDSDPPADAVFFAHHGLETFASVKDLWKGTLVGTTVDIRLWRVPFSEIPRERDARIAWLDAEWAKMDDWLEALAQRSRGTH
jgi:1-acyl-sn-glycerol-3-phosphate acyltransferase